MAVAISRALLLRRSRFALSRASAVRNATSTSEAASNAASKAKESTSQVTSKASEGLSRVTSSAGSVLGKAGAATSNVLGRATGRTGRLINFVQSIIPPTIYYSKVGLELSKLVFQGQKMYPPSMAQFQSYFQPIVNAARNPKSIMAASSGLVQPQTLLSSVRNTNRAQLAAGGVILAELLGFFTVGEMLGKLKLVGYKGAGPVEHH